MEFLDIFLHLDETLGAVIAAYGPWVYALLFLIVFCETGLVVTPFLPGDSLLFAVGAFAATDGLDLGSSLVLLFAAAVIGDTVNYWIGRRCGKAVLERGKLFGLPVKRQHVERTRKFYERYGAKAIVLARFAPIIRTIAPFVAGVGSMDYRTFVIYNLVGGAAWVSLFVFAGYFFGNIPFVKENFESVILAIILISLLPAAVEWLRSRKPSA
jgi:membrane-associated protein